MERIVADSRGNPVGTSLVCVDIVHGLRDLFRAYDRDRGHGGEQAAKHSVEYHSDIPVTALGTGSDPRA